ncbi:MAG TPA: TRAP transporter fused permease subunit [Vicinamibacteria bacterium]|nr:TRAP transporter fused permease subunit [Vicinamibacteria bacterium]
MSAPRRLSRGTSAFVVFYFLYELAYLLGAFSTRYFFVLEESHRAVSLAGIIVLTFLLARARRTDVGPVPTYDYVLMGIGVIGCLYIAPTSRIIELQTAAPQARPLEMLMGIATIVVLLEGTRRVSGTVLPVLLLVSIFYALFADRFPGFLYGRGHSLDRVIGELYLSVEGIFGSVMSLWTRILVVFVLFGGFLQVSGAGKFFIDLALSVAGHLPGGPAKVAVIASGLFGTVSGSAAADVATTGVVTIPLMKQSGYRPAFAGAVEAVASTGGILLPPMMGMVAFLVAEFLDIPYLQVCLAAAIPAALYYGSLYALVDLEARRAGLRGLPKSELPPLSKTLAEGWHFLVPLVVLVITLAVFRYPPGKSALYAIGALLLVTLPWKSTRFTGTRLVSAFERAARTSLVIGIICGSVGILITSLAITGATLRGAILLVEASGGHLLLLLALTAFASLLLGTGVPAIGSYVLLATTVAPAITELGVPVIAAHLFVLYWGISHVITPPVGGALYIASSFSGVDIWRQGFEAMKLGIGLFAVPFIFCYHPELLMIGAPGEILWRCLVAAVAMLAVAAALVGYLRARLTGWQRGLLGAAAVSLIVGSPLAIGAGAAAIAGLLVRQQVSMRTVEI